MTKREMLPVPSVIEGFSVDPVESAYLDKKLVYNLMPYNIEFSLTPTKNENPYYESDVIPSGWRRSTATDEVAIIKYLQRLGKDIRLAYTFPGFGDGKTDGYKWHSSVVTSTALRVPEGWENGRLDEGTNKFPRIVLIENEPKGMVFIPNGEFNTVEKWDAVFGVPKKMTDSVHHIDTYEPHLIFDPITRVDPISGKRDAPVYFQVEHHPGGGRYCLYVCIRTNRSDSKRSDLRLVRGTIPEVEELRL